MEKYQEAREKSLKCLNIADHMLTMTYPLVRDSKLLVAVMENLFLAQANALAAILYWERLYKRIPPFHDNFESKLNLFRSYIIKKYNVSAGYIGLLQEVKELIYEHKQSAIEFSRKNRFVIASDDYRLKTLSMKQMKDILQKTKLFIEQILTLLEENERSVRKVH
ncbi:hypothetical protein JW930_04030 [Candidatus Woesearchaeota archaeon]|nr:hypothetical protein [Candidatus Woesearchaeota archaeon]